MQYLRTASGTFINSAAIARLSPERGDADAVTGWIATCHDGRTVALAPYFARPGRIDALLDRLPAADTAPQQHEQDMPFPCSAQDCPCA